MKFRALIWSLLFILPVCEAQQPILLDDTLKLNDVVVKGRPLLRSAGFTRTVIDSLSLTGNYSWSLSEILRSSSPLFIKSYGPGGVSTVSLRGTGASQTVVTWNGINLNSPMLGQTDFGMIPAIAADVVSIHNGGSSLASVQGGLGGVVEIETRPVWSSPGLTTLSSLSAGSYGRHAMASVLRYGNDKWRFATRLNYSGAENDFWYANRWLTGEVTRERRVNAAYKNAAIVQEIWTRSERSVSGMKIWLQENNRLIPVPVNISASSHNEKLDNRLFNGVMTHDQYFGSDNSLSLSALFQGSSMDYSDNVTDLSSLSSFSRMSVNASLFLRSGNRSALRTGISAESAAATTGNYSSKAHRNIITFSVSGEHKTPRHLDLNFNSALSIADGSLVTPDVSAGAELKLLPGKNLSVKANAALKSRLPTLNDLFWNPGGNPGLKPEKAANSEACISYRYDFTPSLFLLLEGSVYFNNITNMIVWLPGESGLWAPVNIGHVVASGIESSFSVVRKYQGGYVRLMTSYYYSGSVDRLTGFNLIYVPSHTGHLELRTKIRWFSGGTSVNLCGKRFVSADNSLWMPRYAVTDIWAGISSENRKFPVAVNIKLENALNVSYQAVAYHPMPPASVLVNIVLSTSSPGRK